MSLVTPIALIVVPLAFNGFFAGLGAVFDYPAILRRPTDEVLERFRNGGARLLLLWWGLAMSALAFGGVVVGVSAELSGADPTLLVLATVTGVSAALVQTVGLVRWPFAVPHLARESETASPARAEAIDVVFQTLNRTLGVAVGEHLGYLLTGAWTILVGAAMLQADALPGWFGVVGIVIGAVLALCSLEFVGGFEREGWHLAGAVVPFAYIAWSLWLVAAGVLLLVS